MKRLLFLLLSVVMLIHPGRYVHAACIEAPAIDVEVKQSVVVFRGRVTSLEPLPDNTDSIATFDVEQWWKGGPSRTMKMRSCGGKPPEGQEIACIDAHIRFRLGLDYVVFADRYPPNNPLLQASSCGRTAQAEKSADILKWLNANMTPLGLLR
jgi:hypothetical protein